jgi:signal transduction histidine kinase
MLKQTTKIVSPLIVSLLAGIIITLIVDKIENVEVEERTRRSLESNIKNAISSFRESSARHTSIDEKTFMKKFVDTVMKGKVVAYERGSGSIPETNDHDLFLFTLEGADYAFDLYIQNSFLQSELAVLDVPDYISGIVATIIVFTFIHLYSENKKRTLIMQQELQMKSAELDSALERHAALALLGRMSAALAHELKTPIATISNLVQTLPSRRSDEQFVSRFVALTREELNRTQQLIDNLLVYGKEIDIRNSDWIAIEQILKEASNNAMILDIPRTFMLHGDKFYLDLLFKNLLRNSREAGADRINVQLNLPSSDDTMYAQIICDDNGSGFSPATDMEKLMDPFVTSRSRGGGLGLYLARKIAMSHGGSLSLARMDKGARVIITIPRNRIRM